jgi:hypothetical protein
LKVNDENSRIRIRIHPKMSLIRNTVRKQGKMIDFLQYLYECLVMGVGWQGMSGYVYVTAHV